MIHPPERPPRDRSNRADHRGAPSPGSPASGSEGAEPMRQRVAATAGSTLGRTREGWP